MTHHTCPLTLSRRGFIRTAGAVAACAWLPADHAACGAARGTPRDTRQLRLGAPVFERPDDPEELALVHRKQGYRAAYCPAVSLEDGQRIRDTERAFAKHDVVISEVGRWCNLLDADSERRAQNLKKVTEGLALADEIGALCCVDIAGSFNKESWFGPHRENLSQSFFDAAVGNAREIIDAVRPKRAKFAYEMMGWALPDSADSYLDMLRAVDRDAFAVHLDPCNLVNSPDRYYNNSALLNECFDKLGPWIVSCHAKDVSWEVEMQIHFVEVPLGQGALDYVTYLNRLAALPHRPPLMMEHMKGPEEYDASRRHLFDVGREIDIAFAAPSGTSQE